MEHLTEAELQSWIDRELDPDEHARVSRHLEGCAGCRRTVAELRAAAATFSAAMLAYDEDLAAEAGRPSVSAPPSFPALRAAGGASRFVPRWLGRAAAIVLLLGAGAAAAMVPGSPLRDLLVRAMPEPEPVVTPPVVAPAPAEAVGASITVRPQDGELIVRIVNFAPGTRILVGLTDRESAVASLPDGAPDARFVVASSTLDVIGAAAPAEELEGVVEVRLPRSLRTGAVELDGTAVARVVDGRLITLRQVSRTGDEAVFEVGG